MKVVIIVDGGLVQEVYSDDGAVEVEVIDLDVSDFPDEADITEHTEKRNRYEAVRDSLLTVW